MTMEVSGILVAAHELKAPLCLMRQLALALDLAATDSVRHRLQSQLVSVSDRTLNQVNDLIKIARLEDGLFDAEPVSVRGVCDEVVRELSSLFYYEHRGLNIIYHNKSRLVIANRDLLHSIIYNFCVNAARYSHEKTTSKVLVSDRKGFIRVGVRDFGPALPTRLWRELRRGYLSQPTAVAMRPGSSGLGLYIASEFARHMNARIGAIRHRDGTSFYVDLPISQQATLFN